VQLSGSHRLLAINRGVRWITVALGFTLATASCAEESQQPGDGGSGPSDSACTPAASTCPSEEACTVVGHDGVSCSDASACASGYCDTLVGVCIAYACRFPGKDPVGGNCQPLMVCPSGTDQLCLPAGMAAGTPCDPALNDADAGNSACSGLQCDPVTLRCECQGAGKCGASAQCSDYTHTKLCITYACQPAP
jgi:hypothetical protein